MPVLTNYETSIVNFSHAVFFFPFFGIGIFENLLIYRLCFVDMLIYFPHLWRFTVQVVKKFVYRCCFNSMIAIFERNGPAFERRGRVTRQSEDRRSDENLENIRIASNTADRRESNRGSWIEIHSSAVPDSDDNVETPSTFEIHRGLESSTFYHLQHNWSDLLRKHFLSAHSRIVLGMHGYLICFESG